MSFRELLDTHAAAAYLGLSVSTLSKWRHFARPDAPPWIEVGQRIRYDRRQLDEYLAGRTRRPAADTAATRGT